MIWNQYSTLNVNSSKYLVCFYVSHYYAAESEAQRSIGSSVFVRLSVCLSVCLSVSTITHKCVDRLTPNLVCRSLGSRARTLLIFSPLGQTPRSQVKIENFELSQCVHLNSAIESIHRVDPKLTTSGPKVDPQWPQSWPPVALKLTPSDLRGYTMDPEVR